MNDHEAKIQKLKEYVEKCDDVVMAFLFGSQAKGYARVASDWDVGVYLTEENRVREQELWGSIEKILNAEVDLVVLNRAPASIAWTILRTGEALVIKNRRLYLRFMLRVSDEAFRWHKTAEEYYKIFQRSASLSQEDRSELQRIVEFLEQEIGDYKKFMALTGKEYSTDRAKKREVERWAEQIINALIDIAKIVFASERHVVPDTYRMMVQSLCAIPPFDTGIDMQKLSSWTELRNILAHEYLDYRWKELSIFIKETEPLIAQLIQKTSTFLAKSNEA